MKYYLIALFLVVASQLYAQAWTQDQLSKANTAADIEYLSQVEKDVILYINLARLYPKQFARQEVNNYYGPKKYGGYLKDSPYRASLLKKLLTMQALKALRFDEKMYKSAKCFAIESGEAGKTGHKRTTCPEENVAECCSYGMSTGKDVVLQLLIDHGVPSLGHRKICLDPSYTKVGAGEYAHKAHETCTVVNMIW